MDAPFSSFRQLRHANGDGRKIAPASAPLWMPRRKELAFVKRQFFILFSSMTTRTGARLSMTRKKKDSTRPPTQRQRTGAMATGTSRRRSGGIERVAFFFFLLRFSRQALFVLVTGGGIFFFRGAKCRAHRSNNAHSIFVQTKKQEGRTKDAPTARDKGGPLGVMCPDE